MFLTMETAFPCVPLEMTTAAYTIQLEMRRGDDITRAIYLKAPTDLNTAAK
jgi:hypothetical protein